MPLFNVNFPANTLFFYSALKDISNFEILPSHQINGAMYAMSDINGSEIPKVF